MKIEGYSDKHSKRRFRKGLNIKEKVDLLEEYVRNNNEPITGNTVYNGVNIGEILIRIRSNVFSGKGLYSAHIIERLEQNGLLDKRLETLEEKVNRLEKYCRNNIELWNLRQVLYSKYLKVQEVDFMEKGFEMSEELMQKFLTEHSMSLSTICKKVNSGELPIGTLISDLKKAAIDYRYIRSRKSSDKIKPEYIEKLRNAGVGGVFGIQSELEELSEQTGIEVDRFIKINEEFGSLKNFKKIYIKFMSSWKTWKRGDLFSFDFVKGNMENIQKIFGGVELFYAFREHLMYFIKNNMIVTSFNINGSFVPKDEDRKLTQYMDFEDYFGIFFDETAMEEGKKKLLDSEVEVLSAITVPDRKVSMVEVAKERGVSKTRVIEIRKRAIKKLLNSKPPIWFYGKSDIRRKRFIATYFKHKDIFVTQDSYEISEELRRELLEIIGYDFDKKVQENGEVDAEALNAELRELIVGIKLAYEELESKTKEEIDAMRAGAPEAPGENSEGNGKAGIGNTRKSRGIRENIELSK